MLPCWAWDKCFLVSWSLGIDDHFGEDDLVGPLCLCLYLFLVCALALKLFPLEHTIKRHIMELTLPQVVETIVELGFTTLPHTYAP